MKQNLIDYIKEKVDLRMSADKVVKSRILNNERLYSKWQREYYRAKNSDNKLACLILGTLGNVSDNDHEINWLMSEFTLGEENRIAPIENSIEQVKKLCNGCLINVEIVDDVMTIETKDGVTKLAKLSNYINVSKGTEKDLLSYSRYGKCFDMSISIIQSLKDIDNDKKFCIATAKHHSLSKRIKCFHSWVEQEVDGDVFCLDYTRNSIMKDADYYKYHHIDPNEISRIDSQTFNYEYPIVLEYVNQDPKRKDFDLVYLSDRDFAMHKIERDSKVM